MSPFLRVSRAQRRSARDVGGPGRFAAPSRYVDGGASRRVGAKKMWAKEKALPPHKRRKVAVSGRRKKQAVMLANRASSNEPAARAKAVSTLKQHQREATFLDTSQKRSRRVSTDYNAPFGKVRSLVFSFVLHAFFTFGHQNGSIHRLRQSLRQ